MQQRAMSFEDRMRYPDGFWKWISEPKNLHLYNEFSLRAHEMARRRERYSARTIIEVLRWNTDLSDTSETFKIQNNMVPGMARLWMRDNGHIYPRFFELRDHLGWSE